MKGQWREASPEKKEGNPCNPVLEGKKVIDCTEGDDKGRYRRGEGQARSGGKVCVLVCGCVCANVCVRVLLCS